jgi:hypothetical protein
MSGSFEPRKGKDIRDFTIHPGKHTVTHDATSGKTTFKANEPTHVLVGHPPGGGGILPTPFAGRDEFLWLKKDDKIEVEKDGTITIVIA